MRLIGGLVFWDHAQAVLPAHLRAMAGGVAGAGQKALSTAKGPIGLLSTLGPDSFESTEDVWAVGDLDLTNLAELPALTGRERCDTEILTALYAMEGPNFVRRLCGAFAFALWDRRQHTLLLAVDRFGMKRLYYVTDPRRTAFASRSSAILGAPDVGARVDPTAIYTYLNFGFIPSPGTIFTDIHRLPPGHILLLRRGEATVKPYWQMTYSEEAIGRAEGAARLYRLTEEAVGRTLRGTAPKEVGTFLSGGTDSSTVTGLMGRLTGERVNAFSIGFEENRYNELDYADLAARHFGAAHYTQIVTPGDALNALPRLVEAFDEPFGNNSAIGTFFCAQLARQCGVTWLLAGDGGDEIFGGNERYRTDRVFSRYHRLPALLRKKLIEPILSNLPDRSLIGRCQRYVRRANLPNPRRFYSYEFFFAQEADRLLTPDFRAAVDAEAPYAILESHYDRVQASAELNRLLSLDLRLIIGDNDLLKVTRTAELAGVAARFPLLDLPLVEFTGTLPAHFKVRGLEKRYLFKRAFQTLLPPATLAKRKHGFGVPTSAWLRNHSGFHALSREMLLSARARQRGYFRPGAVETLFERHAVDATPFYGDVLWTLLMLELWHRRHLDRGKAA